MTVDLADVQSHILRSINPAAAIYLFFRIENVAQFRSLLREALNAGAPVEDGLALRIYAESHRDKHGAPAVSMNIGFTPPGLATLGVDPDTLSTFPEPFRDGMAARAALLGDTGPSAPETWDGYLGSRQVHGVMWWNFRRDCSGPPAPVAKQIEHAIGNFGVAPLHVETGQANYHPRGYSFEHFGFRDGVSQPWVDFGQPPPAPGGGTPRDGDSWTPLAAGEFLLGYADEDGFKQPWPCNEGLRQSGTYLVFRKLEQDVAGFRRFVRQAARDADEAQLIASQMMGRCPDGRPLVRPAAPSVGGVHPHRVVNDFRYGRDDPLGRQCPIGAHIRRANPRDSGDRDEARRHRLIRRGIAYGPPLPEDSPGDGERRGILFAALNARIDQQFEFVQSRWMNGGELVGQVGAGRDPITGPHGGTTGDCFVSPSRPAPLTNLTRFVTTRGGDYFFVPGLKALADLAKGENFKPDRSLDPALTGVSIGCIGMPDPLDPKALLELAQSKLLPDGKPGFAIVPAPFPYEPFPGAKPQEISIAYVARHELVTRILKDDETFGVQPYADRIGQILAGRQMLVSLPKGSVVRKQRSAILGAAFPHDAPIAAIVRSIVEQTLVPLRGRGMLDIVADLGRVVPLRLAARLFGITGPSWLSPTAVAARFGRSEMTDMPASWLASLRPAAELAKPLLTLQTWAQLTFAHVFVNVVNAAELARVAACAAAELLAHVDGLIDDARRRGAGADTLLGRLIILGKTPERFEVDQRTYDEHMRMILVEMLVGGVESINKALANWVDFALDRPAVLERAKAAARGGKDEDVDALVREGLRLNPVSPILFRVATKDTRLGDQDVKAGSIVALLIEAAMRDPRQFPRPDDFDVDARQHNPPYLHFGAGLHHCFGSELATVELREMVKALMRLGKLRRAAGPLGTMTEMFRLPTSLAVRFNPS